MSIIVEVINIEKEIRKLMRDKFARIDFCCNVLESQEDKNNFRYIVNELINNTTMLWPHQMSDELIVSLNMMGCQIVKLTPRNYIIGR